MARFRHWLYMELEPSARAGRGLSRLNKIILTVIFVSIAIVILRTEPVIDQSFRGTDRYLNILFFAFFLIEYCARIWSAGEDPRYAGFVGRLRFMVRPSSILDAIAILPYATGLFDADSFIFRLARILRVLSISKMGRYSAAMGEVMAAIAHRRYELLASLALSGVVLLVSATLMYLLEGESQPDAFGSIPRALWWAIATLTTVGYGDVYPLTALGKILAGITAIAAIGLIALPAGVLAAAFSEAFRHAREQKEARRRARREEVEKSKSPKSSTARRNQPPASN